MLESSQQTRAELEQVACRLAQEAGAFIVGQRPAHLGVAHTKSSATDVVTVMDEGSERLLRNLLSQLRPDDGVLGEEGTHQEGRSGITWVVDPIDGTVNYLYELPAYAVSVAACVGDPSRPNELRPVAGAVINPVLGEMFHAHLGGGAFRSVGDTQQPLAVSGVDDLAGALLGTGFSYEPAQRARQGACVAALLPLVRDIRRMGSAALDLCSVAAGRLDVYFESGLHPWDRLAGQLIVTEAGGAVELRAVGDRELTLAGPPVLVAALGAHDLI